MVGSESMETPQQLSVQQDTILYKNTSAVSSTNFGSILVLIFAILDYVRLVYTARSSREDDMTEQQGRKCMCDKPQQQ